MNTLQFSTRQLGIIAAIVVGAALAVFSLGLATATAFTEHPQTVEIQPIEPRPESTLASASCIELPAPAAGPVISADPPSDPATGIPPYGVQAAVFAELDNAIEFAAQHADPEFPARIFRRVDAGNQTFYPVLVGLYQTMDQAQHAKLAFIRKTAIDSFVADASQLKEEIVLSRTLAMLP